MSTYGGLNEHYYAYRYVPTEATGEKSEEIPWIETGSNSQLVLNNLPAGKYNIQIRGIDQHSHQTTKPLEIPVFVDQFFYQKWWFYVLLSIPILVFGMVWVHKNVSDKKRLQLEVNRRTAKIQQSKATIEKQAQQLEELDLAKSRFFTNISHEFRTPLTVISGMVDQITGNDRAKKLIKRNSQVILSLINQILDLRKLESGNLSANYSRGDLVTYFKYLVESLKSLADDKKISLYFESDLEALEADHDPDKLRHIISNLLYNAIKYTPEGGEVKLALDTNSEITPPTYEFVVSDTGLGIPEDKLPIY